MPHSEPRSCNCAPTSILWRCIAIWSVAAMTASLPVTARAQPAPAAPDPASVAEPHDVPANALGQVVARVARTLAPRAAGAIVVGSPLQSDAPAPRGAALVSRVVALIAGAIGPEARAARAPIPLDTARAEAASSPALVYLQVEIAQGELRVTGDVYPIPRNIWDRSRNASPGPVAHAFASARIDAEVRTFLAPIPLMAAKPVRIPLPEPEVLAMHCGDLDDDGGLELVLVSRRTLAVGRIRQRRFAPMHQAAWESLTPIAPVPWREPLATIATPSAAFVDIGLTDRAHAVRLDARLGVVGALLGMPVPLPMGDACADKRVGSFAAELHACREGDPAPSISHADVPFDAAAAAIIVGANGEPRSVFAVRSPTDGTVTMQDDQKRQVHIGHVGAQMVLADIDLDGDPDLIASKNVLHDQNDALIVRSWRSNGAVEKRWELPVTDGVAAVAVCPADGPGLRALAVATEKELWIVQ